MKTFPSGRLGALLRTAALVAGALCAVAYPNAATTTVDAARATAPADGWASQAGGTLGGANATTDQVYTVANRSQLLAAIANGGTNPKIIKLSGIIDMTEGTPYTTTADQAARGTIRLKNNTTLIGADSNSGLVNGTIVLTNVSQVIIRNLKIVNPCDVGPIYDPNDGSGNWNAAYDAIGISGSDHIWIDHNSFTDAPVTDNFLPIENGHLKQCHDGAVDITNASDYVTVSYNVFGEHDKNNLIGSSATATTDEGKLRVTFSNNMFRAIQSRAPRVRFGQVHLFNNYYVGDKKASVYANSYSVGAGENAKILSNANVFEIANAANCDAIIKNPGDPDVGAFRDTGSLLNGAALGACAVPTTVTWTPPYAYTPRPAALVKANVVAQAGGGKLSTSITGTGKVTVDTSTLTCPTSGLYFCDDFQDGTANKWALKPFSTTNGTFSVVAEASGSASKVLQYAANSTGGVIALVNPSAFTGVTSGDYYVEARIKPMTNGTTSNKLLYLVARYVDANNWYGAGLNVQSATTSTQVEIAKMLSGALTRPVQAKAPIAMDTQFYTVRFELLGTTLTVYLDGVKMGSMTDSAFTQTGLIGFYTANKSFQIDDIHVGDPHQKPVQLTLSPAITTYAAEAGDRTATVTVTAKASDGNPDSFTVTSSNPAVVSATVSGTTITLTPLSAGTSNIVVTSGSDPTITRTIAATIGQQFVQPTQTYSLTGASFPAAQAGTVNPDTHLKLTFDSAPTLGSASTIRIFRKSDDALIDVIHTDSETDSLGYAGQTQVRRLNTKQVRIDGNTVTITPHLNKLAYGTEYYVAIGNGVFNNTTLGGLPFVGIGKLGGWSFTTKATAPSVTGTITVDDDGAADFSTVQGALDFAMQNYAKTAAVTINVKNGTYDELLWLYNKDNVTIKGESRDGTVIRYANYDTLNTGTGASQASTASGTAGGRSLMLAEGSDLLVLDTLTLNNTTLRSSSISGQAETLYFSNDNGRLIAKNAAFYSEQDTLNLRGWSWFYNTLVSGNVDFIWGSSHAALFENSEIRSVGDTTSTTSGGYVVQARVPSATDAGFVFLNSSLTHGPGPGPNHGDVPAGATYLARSPGGTSSWDNVAYVNCKMDVHVAAVGWAGLGVNGQPAPNPTTPTAASGWREYGTTTLAGVPIDLRTRVGGYILSDSDVASKFANRAMVFAAYGSGAGWNPQP